MLAFTTPRYCCVYIKNLSRLKVLDSFLGRSKHVEVIQNTTLFKYKNTSVENLAAEDGVSHYVAPYKHSFLTSHPRFWSLKALTGTNRQTESLRLFSHSSGSSTDLETPASSKDQKDSSESEDIATDNYSIVKGSEQSEDHRKQTTTETQCFPLQNKLQTSEQQIQREENQCVSSQHFCFISEKELAASKKIAEILQPRDTGQLEVRENSQVTEENLLAAVKSAHSGIKNQQILLRHQQPQPETNSSGTRQHIETGSQFPASVDQQPRSDNLDFESETFIMAEKKGLAEPPPTAANKKQSVKQQPVEGNESTASRPYPMEGRQGPTTSTQYSPAPEKPDHVTVDKKQSFFRQQLGALVGRLSGPSPGARRVRAGLRIVKYPPNVKWGSAVSEDDVSLMNDARMIFDEAIVSVLPHFLVRKKLQMSRTILKPPPPPKEETAQGPKTAASGTVTPKSVTPRTAVPGAAAPPVVFLTLKVDGVAYNIKQNVYVVGFGKAVIGMARAVDEVLGKNIVKGVISVPLGIQNTFKTSGKMDMLIRPDSRITVMEGAPNNIPDAAANSAAMEIMKIAEQVKERDILIVLISGGGSALLPCPKPPVTLEDMTALTHLMSKSGASIIQMNTVRKQLEVLKGGGLARLARRARVIAFILSDVIGDPIDFIAGGPTVKDNTTARDALHVLTSLHIAGSVPHSITNVLQEKSDENATCADWSRVQNILIGSNSRACNAACAKSAALGYLPFLLSVCLEGEAQEVGRMYVNLAYYIHLCLSETTHSERKKELERMLISAFKIGQDRLNILIHAAHKAVSLGRKGLCVIAGGETTVVVKGSGVGGRNQEMAVSFALELDVQFPSNSFTLRPGSGTSMKVIFLAAGTDGIDGPTSAAGGVVSVGFVTNASHAGLDAYHFLEKNDTFTLLSKVDGGLNHVITGQTGTNVMDIYIMLLVFK